MACRQFSVQSSLELVHVHSVPRSIGETKFVHSLAGGFRLRGASQASHVDNNNVPVLNGACQTWHLTQQDRRTGAVLVYVRWLGTRDTIMEPARLYERLPQWRHRATVILAAAVRVIHKHIALRAHHCANLTRGLPVTACHSLTQRAAKIGGARKPCSEHFDQRCIRNAASME